MMNYFFALLYCVWFIRIGVNLLSYTYLWRLKEYRWDRMIIHVRIVSFVSILFPALRKPPRSIKTFLLFIVSIAVVGFFIVVTPIGLFWKFLFADLLSFPLTFLIVKVLALPTYIYHQYSIYLATKKLRKNATLFSIGITGSFGKTSVKEYAETILSTKFSVLKTEASKNSPIGIAEVVLSQLTNQQIFIAEMGAYKQCEIAAMARLVQPQIGVITAINPQHQDLFKSIETTMKAKYELMQGLVGKKIGIFNADNDKVIEMGKQAEKEGISVLWYSMKNKKNDTSTIFATNIHADLTGLSFSCSYKGQTKKVVTKLLGAHQSSNILAAIGIALQCGMSLEEAANACENLRPVTHVLERLKGAHGSTFIDDTFNNNPDAAIAALSVLAHGKGKKILVFQPMIELGAFAKESHEQVGKYAGTICDAIFLTNANWSEDFIRGVNQVNKNIPVYIWPISKACEYLKTQAKREDLVLFKGKESAAYLQSLQS